MEINSGVSFHEAQIAVVHQWIGLDLPGEQKTVTLTHPSPTTEGIMVSQKSHPKTKMVPIPATVEEVREIVATFEHGSDEIRGDGPSCVIGHDTLAG